MSQQKRPLNSNPSAGVRKEVNIDIGSEFNSLFKSIKSGVQTGVKTAVKAGLIIDYSWYIYIGLTCSFFPGQDTRIRFSLEPYTGDPSYNQWKDAMKMVARLPEGVPTEFRRKLWLTLAEKYLSNKGKTPRFH